MKERPIRMSAPPTLDELKAWHEREQQGRSRFHKSICPNCGALVTNQAMGRKAHMEAHKRADKSNLCE